MREFEDKIHIPTEYDSLDDAFHALPEPVKRHSIRVAEYIQVLFESAINVEMYLGDAETMMRRENKNYEGIYWSGYFHEIGLLAIPEDCRTHSQWDTFEKELIHRQHVYTGIDMVDYYGINKESVDEFELQMIHEAILYHHERWDGSGYPDGLVGKEIPMTALLLACADSLDNRISEMVSERGFEDAVKSLLTDKTLDNEVRLVLKYCTSGLRKVYKRHENEYRLISPPENFVVRRKRRMLKLQYQSHPCLENIAETALRARPSFFDKSGTELDFEMVKGNFERKNMLEKLCSYFLYEAADMINRVNAYPFDISYLSLYMLPDFMELEKLGDLVDEMVMDTGISKKDMAFDIARDDDDNRGEVCRSNVTLLEEKGFTVREINLTDYESMSFREEELDANDMVRLLIDEYLEDIQS